MRNELKTISGYFFYLLGASFFIAYLLLHNELWAPWPKWWMQVADLPLALSAIVYGGTSLYISVTHHEKRSKLAMIIIGLPLIALFGLFVVLNFWNILF